MSPCQDATVSLGIKITIGAIKEQLCPKNAEFIQKMFIDGKMNDELGELNKHIRDVEYFGKNLTKRLRELLDKFEDSDELCYPVEQLIKCQIWGHKLGGRSAGGCIDFPIVPDFTVDIPITNYSKVLMQSLSLEWYD